MQYIAKDSSSFKKLVMQQNLSKCAEEYMLCLADPIAADVGCMPTSLISVPSRKMKVFASGSLGTSSTNGNGFIIIRPGMCAFNNNLSSTVGAIRYTTGAFTGSAFNLDTATTGVMGAQTNSEYQISQVGTSAINGIQYRLVACAIEVEASTPWSTRGGIVNGICEPDHSNLGGANEANIAILDSAFREAVSSGGDSKFQVKYNGPADPTDLDYHTTATGSEPINEAFMGIFFSGPIGQTYLWRVVAHFEIIGASARGKTITWADPHGAGLAQAIVAKTHAENGANHHDSNSFWGTISNALHEGVRMTSSGLDKVAGLAKSATKAITSLPGPAVALSAGKQLLGSYASGAIPRAPPAPRVQYANSKYGRSARSVSYKNPTQAIAARSNVKAVKAIKYDRPAGWIPYAQYKQLQSSVARRY